MGSRVPRCPMLFSCNIRRRRATTSWDVQPAGLSITMSPLLAIYVHGQPGILLRSTACSKMAAGGTDSYSDNILFMHVIVGLSGGIGGSRKVAQDQRKYKCHDKVGACDKECEQQQPRPAGHAYSCNEPDSGRGRKPLHLVFPQKDETGANEADAGDNLRRHTRGVKNNTAVSKNICKSILRDQQKKRRRDAHNRVGTESRTLVTEFTFQPNRSREQKGSAEFHELLDTLPGNLGYQHASILAPPPELVAAGGNRIPQRQKSHACYNPSREQSTRAYPPEHACFREISHPVLMMVQEHEVASRIMEQIRNCTGNFSPPEWACPTQRALFEGLREFDADLQEHIHLENDVLFPRGIQMEAELRGMNTVTTG